MASLYQKGAVWYAPDWRNLRTGALIKRHSLGTADQTEAEIRWIEEQGRELAAAAPVAKQLSIAATRSGDTPLAEVFDLYLAKKKHGIAAGTYASYVLAKVAIIRRVGNPAIRNFVPPRGTQILQKYVTDEIARLGGRTHSVKKRLEALFKPALKYAVKARMLAELPDFPDVVSDYESHGRRESSFAVDEFVAFRNLLPERSMYEPLRHGRFAVYPRLWADLAVCTGMHESDLHQFRGEFWRRLGAQWYRINSKGIRYYPPCWLPCDAYLQEVLTRAYAKREWGPTALLVADRVPPAGFMRVHLEKAARAVGLPWTPSAIDFRHTFAVWKRDNGWQFDETARVLGNSSGMVRRVYAQIPTRRMVELTDAVKPQAQSLLRKIDGEEAISVEKPAEKLADVVQLLGGRSHKKGGQ